MNDKQRGTAVQLAPELLAASGDRHLSYTFELFRYVCFLNEKAENRANCLIVATSVIGLGISSPITQPGAASGFLAAFPFAFALLAASLISFALSVLSAVIAVLPRTYDKGIPINHGVIGRMSGDEYVEELLLLPESDAIRHFGLEINILCKIANTRFMWVNRSARFFFAGVMFSASAALSAGITGWIGRTP